MELTGMRAWPASSGGTAVEPEAALPELEYAGSDTASLADRCAAAANDWGTDKVAAAQQDPGAIWKDPQAHPLVLTLMVLHRYGNESLEWDPEVLRVTLMRDGLQVSNANWARVLAVRVLLESPSPWRQWEVFHWMGRALAGYPPNFVFLEAPELGHLFVTADIMTICDPKRETGLEVDKYVAAALKHEGHVYAPAPLDFAQRELENPQLHCTTCGALFVDQNDIKCITCGETSLKKIPFEFAAQRDEVAQLFNARKSMPFERSMDTLPETAAGNLAYDLLVHFSYAARIRRMLLAQLRTLTR